MLSPQKLQLTRSFLYCIFKVIFSSQNAYVETSSTAFLFFRELLLRRPKQVREFAASYFTNPSLAEQVQKKMESK